MKPIFRIAVSYGEAYNDREIIVKNIAASLGVLATVLTATAAPSFAAAQDYRYSHDSRYDHRVDRRHGYARRSRYYGNCRRDQRSSANKGTLAGALVGGASGALIGGDALGALVGAGVGAVGGHEIAKRRVRC